MSTTTADQQVAAPVTMPASITASVGEMTATLKARLSKHGNVFYTLAAQGLDPADFPLGKGTPVTFEGTTIVADKHGVSKAGNFKAEGAAKVTIAGADYNFNVTWSDGKTGLYLKIAFFKVPKPGQSGPRIMGGSLA